MSLEFTLCKFETNARMGILYILVSITVEWIQEYIAAGKSTLVQGITVYRQAANHSCTNINNAPQRHMATQGHNESNSALCHVQQIAECLSENDIMHTQF